jgi:hypothetical protein
MLRATWRGMSSAAGGLRRLIVWAVLTAGFLCRALLVLWGMGALYFSNLPWAAGRTGLAIAFGLFGLYALWISRRAKMFFAFAGVFLFVLGWWVLISPKQDRVWRADVAKVPRAVLDGDEVRLINVRNFDYESRTQFTPRYDERVVKLSALQSMDFFISYWQPGPVAHTFVSFNFADVAPVCISIEVRPEEHEGFDPLGSLFKQFELIYIVGEERDLVRSRTNYRDEQVYRYRIRTTPEAVRLLFLTYLDKINDLAERPEFYHLLSNSCTVNIVQHARAIGGDDHFDLRYILNGLVDRYLYGLGVIDTTLPFSELRSQAHLNAAALAADDDADFSAKIRTAVSPTVK